MNTCYLKLAFYFMTAAEVIAAPSTDESVWLNKLTPAVAQDNWDALLQVEKDAPEAFRDSQALRIMMAHTYTRKGRHNDASLLFFELQSQPLAETWAAWTERLAKEHPQSVAARLFRMDALTRGGDLKGALRTLNEALEGTQDASLLHARAVTQAKLGLWSEAIRDFGQCLATTPKNPGLLADMGMMWVQQKDGAKGAKAAFAESVRLSPDFLRGHYGLACMAAVLGDWKTLEVGQNFLENSRHPSARHFVQLLTTALGDFDPQLLVEYTKDPKKAGMRIDKIIEDAKKGDWGFQAGNLKTGNQIVAEHPDLRQKFEQGISDALKNASPKVKDSISGNLDRYATGHLKQSDKLFGKSTTQTSGGGNTASVDIAGVNLGGTTDASKTISKTHDHSAAKQKTWGDSLRGFENAWFGEKKPAAGIKTDLNEATLDDGDWPFVAIFEYNQAPPERKVTAP